MIAKPPANELSCHRHRPGTWRGRSPRGLPAVRRGRRSSARARRFSECVDRGLGARQPHRRAVHSDDLHALNRRERCRIDDIGEDDRHVPERSLAEALDRVDVDQPTGTDDPHAVGDVLHLVERVRGDEDRSSVGRRLAEERPHLGLEQRIEAGRGLVEDDDVRAVHEGLHDADLLSVPFRELADRPVEVEVESQSRARRGAARRTLPRRRASESSCSLSGETIREAKVARQVADAPTGRKRRPCECRVRAARPVRPSDGSVRAGDGSSSTCRRRSARGSRRPRRPVPRGRDRRARAHRRRTSSRGRQSRSRCVTGMPRS